MSSIIEVQNLSKNYGDIQAVKGIDFSVKKGDLFAFLGPNGAGKSTTIEIICTLLKPNQGKVYVAGYELGKEDHLIRKCIGIVFQYNILDPLLTVEENLIVRGSFYGLKGKQRKKALEFATSVSGVGPFLKRSYGTLSGGQKRRADIARALIHTPQILFLDEPTTGLDPQTRISVWETITDLQKNTNLTVFLTTHYMEEAAKANSVAIIDNGLIVARGTPEELKEKHSKDRLLVTPKDREHLEKILESAKRGYEKVGEQYILTLSNTLEALPILDLLKDNLVSFQVTTGDMDDVFVGITGKQMREDVV